MGSVLGAKVSKCEAMKFIPCSYIGCQYLRTGREEDDEQPRVHQQVLVEDNYKGSVYCSNMCQICDNLV